MNARLQLRVIQCHTLPSRAPEAPPLRLLGEGLDAIIQHTELPMRGLLRLIWSGTPDPRLPSAPTVEDRLNRYGVASSMHGLHVDPSAAERRLAIGETVLSAWKCGHFPKIRARGGLVALPRPLQQQLRSAQR